VKQRKTGGYDADFQVDVLRSICRKGQDSSPEGAIRLQDQGIACNILDQQKPTRLASSVDDFGLKQHEPASGGRCEAECVQGNTKVDPGGGTRRSEPASVF